MPEESVLVQVRLPARVVKLIDHYCVDHDLYRAGAIEQLVMQAFEADTQKSLDRLDKLVELNAP